jgi:hypothetical protein
MRRFPTLVVLLFVAVVRPGAARAQDTTSHPAAAASADTSTHATAAHEAPPADAKAAQKRGGDKSRLTADEIDAAKLPNAYELVDRLRRPWLRRDALTGGDVVVYMDEQNLGGPEKLHDIPAVDVAELQYLPNEQAVRRWGAAIAGSVIVVIRRR